MRYASRFRKILVALAVVALVLAARPDEGDPQRVPRRGAPGVLAHRHPPALRAVRRILDGEVFRHSVIRSLPRGGFPRQKMR